MCGRYYVKENMWDEVNVQFSGIQVTGDKAMDITPGMTAAAITEGINLQNLKWGFDGFDGKLLINARAEGIEAKRTFADSIMDRRCVLPASGFYEWDNDKNKVTFTLPDEPVMYLAGIYKDGRFVIITREANASMIKVHDRMPLIIGKCDVEEWVNDRSAIKRFLIQTQPELCSDREYEQLSFFEKYLKN